MQKTARERLEENAERIPWSGCWLWTGHAGRYGQVKIGGKVIGAHRAAYQEFVGPIPDGVEVCHKCDVGVCINPDHLFLSSHVGNMADMVAKGRGPKADGERNNKARISSADADYIKTSPARNVDLAAKFCLSSSHICNIKKGRFWA